MIFTAIETLGGHVAVAKEFKNNLPNLWYAMAQYDPWADELVPPAEDIMTDHLDEIIGLKKFDTSQLVAPLSSVNSGQAIGDVITYDAQDWVVVSDDDALKYGARYVYLDVTINPGDLPYSMYRQIGVFSGLIPAKGSTDKSILVPTQVSDYGLLIGYDNRLSQRYTDNMKIIEKIVLKF